MRDLTNPEFRALRRDLASVVRPRIKLDGVALPREVLPEGLSRVDFVNCVVDTPFHRTFRARLGAGRRPLAIEDASFTDCQFPQLFFRSGIFRDAHFERVAFAGGAIGASLIEVCTFVDCRFDDLDLVSVEFRRVKMLRHRVLPRAHWHQCTFDDVVIAGLAQTLVLSEPSYILLDVAALHCADCDFAIPPGAKVRLPAFDDAFGVARNDALRVIASLTGALPAEVLQHAARFVDILVGDPVVIDRSMFSHSDAAAFDASEVDRIMTELRRYRLEATPSW